MSLSAPAAPVTHSWEIRGPAVVTGAGQGLGRAFALALAGAGVAVAVADRAGDRARAVTAEIEAAGGRALAVEVDVADEASVSDLAAAVGTGLGLGPPAVLVNNAAIFSTLRMGPFDEIDPAVWDQVLRVNVTGTWLACRALVPLMAQAGYGKVVNISSATIWTGRPGYLHYVTSKAALLGLTRALAAEVGGSGVRVNAITPGSTETEVRRDTITPQSRSVMAEATALRRVQVPSDLIGALLFLSSTASDFVTGQTVNVDGGLAFH
jgi:3-oxoacyl-[acyl-carrier protein] reductase